MNPIHPFATFMRRYATLGHLPLVVPTPPTASKTEAPTSLPSSSPNASTDILDTLKSQVLQCTKCPLHQHKTHYVFGEGNPHAEIMFVGEGPGRDEDISGRPFVGRAGQLLTRIIQAMHLAREDVYIANVVKCRPPQNRPPLPDEAGACMPYLEGQIAAIRPKVLVLLGATAMSYVLRMQKPISHMRGTWQTFPLPDGTSVDVMPTYHPAALLRNPLLKKNVWEDMKMVLNRIGKPL